MYKNEEMKILVIIPAYNEEKNIKETVERLKESAASVDYVVINELFQRQDGKNFEKFRYYIY